MTRTASPVAAGSTDVRAAVVVVCAALLLTPAHALAQEHWHLVRTEHLTLVGDQPPALLGDVGLQLETFRLAVGQLISNASRPPALPTVVVVLGQRRSMQRYLPPSITGSDAVAGYFRQDRDVNRIVLSLEGFSRSPSVAYHEYTHLLLRGTLTSPPLWLEEGIAEYYGTYTAALDGSAVSVGRVDEPPRLLDRDWMPIADLITFGGGATALAHDNATASAFYGESAMLVHYLLTRLPNGGAAINRYLALLGEDRAPADAFLEAFGSTPESMDETLGDYIASGSFQPRRILLPSGGLVRQAGPAVTLTAAETRAWQGEVQRSVGWPDGAAEVEAAAAAEPESGMVQLLLGRTRLAMGDETEGHRALTHAADSLPTDFLAQFWKGFWFVHAPPDATADTDAAVRALQRATSLRPSSADAQALLAAAMVATTPPQWLGARTAIDRAIALAPERLEFTLTQAAVLAGLGEIETARAILTALAEIDDDPQLAERARALLRTLGRRLRQP